MINSEIIYLLCVLLLCYCVWAPIFYLFIFEEERLDFLYGNRAEHFLSVSRSVLASSLRDYTKSNL